MNHFSKDAERKYVIRISQGLLSAGKGLITGNPFYSDGFLYSKVSMAGLFVLANCMLDMTNLMVKKFNFCIYYLVCSIHPRWLFTVEKNNPDR